MVNRLSRADSTEIELRWERLCHAAGLHGARHGMYAVLMDAYRQPERHYHDIVHILDCLRQLDLLEKCVDSVVAVALAIWWHDAVYDTHRNDNEAASAALACEQLGRAGVSKELARQVRDLVLATRHEATAPDTADARILVDIDLSILGQPPEVFDRYERAVRREYAWVPDAVFWSRRAEILESFLARRRIFQHPEMASRLEAPARNNLCRAIARARAVSPQACRE